MTIGDLIDAKIFLKKYLDWRKNVNELRPGEEAEIFRLINMLDTQIHEMENAIYKLEGAY